MQKIYVVKPKERFIGQVGSDVKAFHFSGQVLFGVKAKWVDSDAAIAQLGERTTEDRKVPGSKPGCGTVFALFATGRLFKN